MTPVPVKDRKRAVYYKSRTGAWGVWNGTRLLCVAHHTRLDRCTPCSRAHCKSHKQDITACNVCKTPPKGFWIVCAVHKTAAACGKCAAERTIKLKGKPTPHPKRVFTAPYLCAVHKWTQAGRGCKSCKLAMLSKTGWLCKAHKKETRACHQCKAGRHKHARTQLV